MINYQELYNMLTACIAIAPKKDTRYYLNGVHIVQDSDGLKVEATDGHSLVQFKTTNMIQGKMEFDCIVDIKDVVLLCQKIKGMGYNKTNLNEVTICDCDEDSTIEFNVMRCSLVNGFYPACERVIWKDSPAPIEAIGLDARYLANLPKIVKPFKGNKALPIKLEFKDSMSSVRATFDTGVDGLNAIILIMPCRL